MTREEAEKFLAVKVGLPRDCAHSWVDVFASLGMIKLDDPLSPLEALADAISKTKDSGLLTAARVNGQLEANGYKIVPR